MTPARRTSRAAVNWFAPRRQTRFPSISSREAAARANCIGLNGNECTGGYPKPAWQGGPVVTTAPFAGDGVRDLPDISLFAADGLISNSFYVVCESDLNPAGATCNLSTGSHQFIS